jgi:hypothetical protein
MTNLREYENYIQNLAYKNKIIIDDVTATIEHDVLYISVYIDWGNWKHDHLRLKNLIYDELKPDDCFEEVTETKDSDCYSAKHTFIWYKKKDTCAMEE